MITLVAIMAGLFGFGLTYAVIPRVKLLAMRRRIVSRPGGHSSHTRTIPLLGGAAMFLPFAMVFIGLFLFLTLAGSDLVRPSAPQMLALFAGALWMLCLGVWDDIVCLGWRKKLTGEAAAVIILLLGGHGLKTATIPFFGVVEFGWWGAPIFAFVILTITNAVNLIDGVDGLAGGICFFAAIVGGIIGLSKGDVYSAVIGFTLSGAILAFLRFNFPPATIFMGDGGSLMLGFILGALATSSAASFPGQRTGTMVMIMAPFLPFGIALLDVCLSIIRRWVSGRKLFFPDTDHLHHRLMERVGRPRAVVGILYGFSGLLSVMTLTLVLGPKDRYFTLYMLMSGLVLLALAGLVLRLYLTEGLPKILENRPHIKFLTSYLGFMKRRVRRARSFEEILSLLDTGVRDLDFDRVEVYRNGQRIRNVERERLRHPDSPRVEGEKKLRGLNLTLRWSLPTHASNSYQKYLVLTWELFTREVEARLRFRRQTDPGFGQAPESEPAGSDSPRAE